MVTRRKSIPVNVGGVVIGGAAPIAVQTMTKTDTRDVRATLRQIHELKEAGCEIVRPAVPDREAAEALKEIVKGSPLPVIADIHYDHTLALLAIEAGVHCLRLNPGNIPDRDKVIKVVEAAKERQIPFRIGVNAGSLPGEAHKTMREQHQINRDNREETAARMVEVALGHCKILEDLDYGPGFIKVSLKSTDVWTNIMANRKFAAARAYPIHLGVTEPALSRPAAYAARSAWASCSAKESGTRSGSRSRHQILAKRCGWRTKSSRPWLFATRAPRWSPAQPAAGSNTTWSRR